MTSNERIKELEAEIAGLKRDLHIVRFAFDKVNSDAERLRKAIEKALEHLLPIAIAHGILQAALSPFPAPGEQLSQPKMSESPSSQFTTTGTHQPPTTSSTISESSPAAASGENLRPCEVSSIAVGSGSGEGTAIIIQFPFPLTDDVRESVQEACDAWVRLWYVDPEWHRRRLADKMFKPTTAPAAGSADYDRGVECDHE